MLASQQTLQKSWNYELFPPTEEIEQTSINGVRHYKVPGGQLYPSVTTVLGSLSKDGIKQWEQRVGIEEANRIRTRATTHGTAVHGLAEEYLLGRPVPLASCVPTVASAFRALVPLLEPVDTVYGIETPLFSHRLKTAGRTDLLCSYNGLGTVLDFKTSRTEKKEEYIENYFIQATAYALMAYEMYNVRLRQIVILISVADSPPQRFVKLVDEYIPRTIALFKSYHLNNVA
jgi:genome maintenance exonuclease 1